MLVPFKSKAAADFFMLQAHAQTLLVMLGKTWAPQGIIAAHEVGTALTVLRAALSTPPSRSLPLPLPLSQQASQSAQAVADAPAADINEDTQVDTLDTPAVSLSQRAWPLLDMLQRAEKKQVDVVWGIEN